MIISSIDTRNVFTKQSSIVNSRSHSSLSNISLKTVMPNKLHRETPKALSQLPDFTQIYRSKQDIENRILDIMNEMKKLKTVSKTLKKKEDELKVLQESLLKSNEEVLEAKFRNERSLKLLQDLAGSLRTNNNERLCEVYSDVFKETMRFKQKRNSLVVDDVSVHGSHGPTVNTTREFKVRSPYFTGVQVVNSPRLKKLKVLKCSTEKSVKSSKNKTIENPDLLALFNRIQDLVKYLKKTN